MSAPSSALIAFERARDLLTRERLRAGKRRARLQIAAYTRHVYKLIPSSDVLPVERGAAARAMEFGCSDLGITWPSLSWFVPATAAEYLAEDGEGYFDIDSPIHGLALLGRYIRVHAGLGAARTTHVTLHELRHCWQHSQEHAYSTQEGETDAEQYAHEAELRMAQR